MYETGQEQEHQTYVVDPELVVSMLLAEAEMLRLETDLALTKFMLVEDDEAAPLHDLSPLGR